MYFYSVSETKPSKAETAPARAIVANFIFQILFTFDKVKCSTTHMIKNIEQNTVSQDIKNLSKFSKHLAFAKKTSFFWLVFVLV